MLRITISMTLLLFVTFAAFPAFTYAQEPFMIDDFEAGMDIWSTGQGAGAPPGSIEQINGGHKGAGARITMPEGSGWMIIRTAADTLLNVGENLEAFNMWVNGVEDTDQWTRIMFYGVGDISGQNRWIFDFKTPVDEWTLISTPFEEILPWRNEQRPFDPTILSFLAFVQEASPPLGGEQDTWKDVEFLVDDIEFGLLGEGGDISVVTPLKKLPAIWGELKQHN